MYSNGASKLPIDAPVKCPRRRPAPRGRPCRTQRPTPNAQRPTPNAQRPNTQRPKNEPLRIATPTWGVLQKGPQKTLAKYHGRRPRRRRPGAPNAQHPTPKHPTPKTWSVLNSQRPTPNAQRLTPNAKVQTPSDQDDAALLEL